VVLIGKSSNADGRTATGLEPSARRTLLEHPVRPVDAFDRPLIDQLALVAAGDLFLSPHTGFVFAALACGTSWLRLLLPAARSVKGSRVTVLRDMALPR
jgi:hypothetical protein